MANLQTFVCFHVGSKFNAQFTTPFDHVVGILFNLVNVEKEAGSGHLCHVQASLSHHLQMWRKHSHYMYNHVSFIRSSVTLSFPDLYLSVREPA